MSKAILVLDEMPYYCNNCPCFHDETEACQVDGVLEFRVPYDGKSYKNPRPDWCPLRPVPEYKDVYHIDDRSNYEHGYNCCIDDILM